MIWVDHNARPGPLARWLGRLLNPAPAPQRSTWQKPPGNPEPGEYLRTGIW
jgi:hypothetical protein